ncbi:MAG TPA: O-methyltransferase [Thermoleophilaceae bacterium]|nr:O-methyltransferase [Thermoleophilaceae bacterium]
MTDPTAVDRYLDGLLVQEDSVLAAARADAEAAGLPAHTVAANQGKLLHLLARAVGARRVLELGTLAGYSTIWLARAVGPEGRVVTCEIDPSFARVAAANLHRAGLGDRVEVLVGPAAETMQRLEGPFDLVFIDADKASNDVYLPPVLALSRAGTLIVADNVVREGAVADPATGDPSAQGVRRFLDLVAADPRLTATAVQTVGVKGWDGFALALVSDAAAR